jgi:hypothetical protein
MWWCGAALCVALIASQARGDAPLGYYTVNAAADTVRANATGLTWQRTVPASTYTQSQAYAYCAGLGGGYRLPTILELQSILELTRVSPAIDPTAFPGTPSAQFWTSTARAGFSGSGWWVDFSDGRTGFGDVASALRVRCVR